MPIVWDEGQEPTAGRAVGSAVSALDAKAIQTAKLESAKLLNAANSGGFRISPEGVAPLQKAVLDMQSGLVRLQQGTAMALSQAPKLGSHEYGHAVAAHDQKGAVDDERSASVVLEQFSKVLEDVQSALTKAVENYREAEAGAADSVRQA
ncbi:hypothetical protein ABZ863_02090 [Saccharomonospora sp. NPDC046836]|uniref:hypothetical protein n=1 Tax=Saccharomonospora sp. NPDC046836 TaxID=3156921 RepID=UPI0033E2ED79